MIVGMKQGTFTTVCRDSKSVHPCCRCGLLCRWILVLTVPALLGKVSEDSTVMLSKIQTEDVMKKFYTLIIVGYISFTGWTAYAQQPRGGSIEEMIRSLSSGTTSSGTTSSFMEDIMGQIRDTSEQTAAQQMSAVDEGQQLVVEEVVPTVNQAPAEVIDTRTGRYLPRLKINVTEFPLRSLASANGNSVESKTQTDIIVQRIQRRLHVPQLDLVVKDRTAVISGTVPTERQRGLVESMLRFEPGIDTVQNKIAVIP